jgi:OmpA-OmpF porin, OOP family
VKRNSYHFIVFSLAALFLLTFSSFVSAAETIQSTQEPAAVYKPFYVGIFGGLVVPDELKVETAGTDKFKLENTWAAGAKAGYIFPIRWLAAELEYTFIKDQDIYDPKTGHYKANNLMANILLRYPEGMIRPYIGAGIGWSFGEFGGGSMDESFNALGWQGLAGINLEIIPSLSIDFGYRYFMSKYSTSKAGDATIGDHILSVGLNYHFGGVKPVPPPPPPPPPEPAPLQVVKEKKCPNTPACCIVDADGCSIDSDKDGVCDGCDKCSDTPPGCAVDKDGCPLDSDKDGVCDGMDKCPDTPLGCAIDKDGCPLDSDKDGVCDGRDKCPDTPEIAKVDENGCPYMAVIRLNVQFDYKKSDIKPEFYDEIKKLGDFMKRHPNLEATIEGHTDNIASAKYNLSLSKKRAEAVKKALIEKENIDPKRLKSVGYGLTKPIASNETEEGRYQNRRVQALLEAQETKR